MLQIELDRTNISSTPAGANAVNISYSYWGNGLRLSMNDSGGVKTYHYDELNRLTQLSNSSSAYSLFYAYDPSHNKVTKTNTLPNTGSTVYDYYENGLLRSVTDADNQTTAYYYDSVKNLTEVVYPGNIATANYTYDPSTNRLTLLQNLNAKGSVISQFAYDYDNVGNKKHMKDNVETVGYGYDPLNQLQTVTHQTTRGTISYGYDAAGNRNKFNSQAINVYYNNDNSIQSGYGETFTPDGAGNMIQRTTGSSTTTYGWDSLNRLCQVTLPGNKTVSYVYDGDNHRVKKTVGSAVTNYIYDGNSVVFETDGSSNPTARTYNPGISVKDNKGNKFFYLYDGLGSVVNLIDRKGQIIQSYSYDAYGQAFGVIKDLMNNYRFIGAGDVYSDDDVNLQFMLNRWFDPKLGRFISRDPIEIRSSPNLYGYVNNNPINNMDIMGLYTSLQHVQQEYNALDYRVSKGKLPTSVEILIAESDLDECQIDLMQVRVRMFGVTGAGFVLGEFTEGLGAPGLQALAMFLESAGLIGEGYDLISGMAELSNDEDVIKYLEEKIKELEKKCHTK